MMMTKLLHDYTKGI